MSGDFWCSLGVDIELAKAFQGLDGEMLRGEPGTDIPDNLPLSTPREPLKPLESIVANLGLHCNKLA